MLAPVPAIGCGIGLLLVRLRQARTKARIKLLSYLLPGPLRSSVCVASLGWLALALGFTTQHG